MAVIAAVVWATALAGTTQAAPGTSKRTFTSAAPVAIPDATSGEPYGHTVAPINVTGLTGEITKVTVSLHVLHERIADLQTGLVVPSDTQFSWLFGALPADGGSIGAGCADADRTTFDDGAASSIDSGTVPFAGTYRPQESLGEPLEKFNGWDPVASEGSWTLNIYDLTPGNTGTLECWSLMIETATGQTLRFDSNDQVTINDATGVSGGPGTASSPIEVSGITGSIASVTVAVWITHPNTSDLEVRLVGPGGHQVALARDAGGTGDDFGKSCRSSKMTIFNDAGMQAIDQATAPFVGTFRPSAPLAQLIGLSGDAVNGQWDLRVTDDVETSAGTIECWSLTVQSAATQTATLSVIPRLVPSTPLPGTFNYAYLYVTNPTSAPIANVTVKATMPNTVTELRELSSAFPGCEVADLQLTCAFAEIGPNGSALGGAMAKIGTAKSGKVCLTGTVSAPGISPVTSKACFNTAAYPRGDRGTGYDIGDIAHDFTLVDQSGTPVSLAQFAGKYVLLQFTAGWCQPSAVEVPQDRDEVRALNDSNAMGVEVVYLTVMVEGLNPGVPSTAQDAQDWASTFELTTPVLATSGDTDQIAVQQHATYSLVAGEPVPTVPVSVFIDPDQRIFDVRVGSVDGPGGTTNRFLSELP